MRFTTSVPVLFRGSPMKVGPAKTILGFVPATFDLPEYEDAECPVVATVASRGFSTETIYRVLDGQTYGHSVTRKNGEEDLAALRCGLHRHMASNALAALENAKASDLYPRDIKEFLSLTNNDHNSPSYSEYLDRVCDNIASGRIERSAATSDNFNSATAAAMADARSWLERFVYVGNQRFHKTLGMMIAVDCAYNKTIRVSTEELWGGRKWTDKTGAQGCQRSRGDELFYFSLHERRQAMAFAERMGEELSRRVFPEETKVLDFKVPLESIPHHDSSYAELVRSARSVCYVVGVELARRIRNQEPSIFTDDKTLWRAFDSLLEVADAADPFGTPDEELETAAQRLLDVVLADVDFVNSRYRDLASRCKGRFNHLRISLDRWNERPLELEVSHANSMWPSLG